MHPIYTTYLDINDNVEEVIRVFDRLKIPFKLETERRKVRIFEHANHTAERLQYKLTILSEGGAE